MNVGIPQSRSIGRDGLRQAPDSTAAGGDVVDAQHADGSSRERSLEGIDGHLVALPIAERPGDHGSVGQIGVEITWRPIRSPELPAAPPRRGDKFHVQTTTRNVTRLFQENDVMRPPERGFDIRVSYPLDECATGRRHQGVSIDMAMRNVGIGWVRQWIPPPPSPR